MAELKTKKNNSSVKEFIDSVQNERRKQDAKSLLELYQQILGIEPSMWGDSIVGYGSYHYKSERSRQEGDWPLAGFSPRKQNMTIYIMNGFANYQSILDKLGKFKTSVSCLYVNKLDDIDLKILSELIKKSYEDSRKAFNVD